jgi:hypothetical protein
MSSSASLILLIESSECDDSELDFEVDDMDDGGCGLLIPVADVLDDVFEWDNEVAEDETGVYV